MAQNPGDDPRTTPNKRLLGVKVKSIGRKRNFTAPLVAAALLVSLSNPTVAQTYPWVHPRQHDLAVALREIGRIARTAKWAHHFIGQLRTHKVDGSFALFISRL